LCFLIIITIIIIIIIIIIITIIITGYLQFFGLLCKVSADADVTFTITGGCDLCDSH